MADLLSEWAGVFDIECADWDRFVCGELFGLDGVRFQAWDEQALFDALLARPGVWYAHAGGRYDILWALDLACRRSLPWTARLRGSGVLSVKIGDTELRDSYALVPMSLEKAAPMGGTFKLGFPLSCECGDDCGGYCALRRPLSPRERRKVGEYLSRDCDALRAVLGALIDYCDGEQISLGLTVGGTAWATARHWLDLPSATYDLGTYRAIRQGYYGGRTEVFGTVADAGERYDIHASYPAALSRVTLPHGRERMLSGTKAARAFSEGREGVFAADVRVARTDYPPLPVRASDGRLLYPHGPASGTWTGLELRHATAHGVTVERVRWAIVWEEEGPILAPYARTVWKLRDDAKKLGTPRGDALAGWIKFLANSITGKTGQQPTHGAISFIPHGTPIDRDLIVVAVSRAGNGTFVRTESERVDACAHVQWAAQLTSYARAELHSQLVHAGESALYCDTDSVYATRELTRRIGPGLGEWGHEGSMRRWEAIAPKLYRYETDAGTHVRGKGFSGLTAEGFERLKRGGAWEHRAGVDGIRTAVRSHADALFRARTLVRRLKPVPGWVGGRELPKGATRTIPTTLARYERR